MVHAELTIINEQGIHLGPANKIANLADRYDCQIHFKTEYMDVNAKSIINLISGTFRQGDVIQCVCDGPDEKEALEAMKEILKVKDLSVSNKDVEILKNISFQIKKGEILGIVGESGCGKSTLIRALIQMMNKSEKITNGEILFNEKNLLLLDNNLCVLCGE